MESKTKKEIAMLVGFLICWFVVLVVLNDISQDNEIKILKNQIDDLSKEINSFKFKEHLYKQDLESMKNNKSVKYEKKDNFVMRIEYGEDHYEDVTIGGEEIMPYVIGEGEDHFLTIKREYDTTIVIFSTKMET